MKLEMRTLKNIAAAAMTLAVVFGAASLKPVTANAAEASVSASIEEENSYISFQDEAYQNEFLRRVNNERAKAGLFLILRSSQWYQVVHCSQRVRRDGCRCWRECRMGQRFS